MSSADHLIKPEIEEHTNQLLSQMTLGEKIGQLNQYFSQGQFDPEIIRNGQAGSVINASGALSGQGFTGSGSAEVSNHIQKLALDTRLGIPQLFGRDVIHGYRTVFPIPLAQAAAWRPELTEQAAAVAAREASADGIKWTFAPMMDIARDARWGRIAEGNGEDPYLGQIMAAAAVRGFQGQEMSAPDRVVACAKHYVGYGSAEGGRDYDNGEISEPTLRDVYLPPFRSAVEAGVGTLMSAFLDLNGVPATGNRRLLTDVLRGEWGFEGFVVSDWDSVAELINHGVAEDAATASVLALRAGVDMDMVSGAYLATLENSFKAGKISLEEIDTAVRRILRVKHLAGLFDHPLTDESRAGREILTSESRALARQFGAACMVLLKNENDLLPLDNRFKKIAVVGPLVHATGELYGSWAPDGRPHEATAISEALQKAAPDGVELTFSEHSDRALMLAEDADAVVVIVGENPYRSGENANVADLSLPPGQAELVAAAAQMGRPVALVVIAGRPLAITNQVKQADAVLYAWQPGIEGGAALGDVLFGAVSPSGRLPVSMPRATGQVPLYYNRKNSGRPVGIPPFTTRYVDLSTAPLFPFGYGLSYTRFAYGSPRLSSETLRGQIEINAEVTNTGARAGNELVQLYVRDLVGSLTRPVRELKGFQRVELQPGETRLVSFTLREEDLAFTGSDGVRKTEPGEFRAWVAPDSASGEMVSFRI